MERHRAKITSLVFVRRNRQVLLRRHGAGHRFEGRWNGIGGHVEAGEDPLRSAHREVREEAGIEIHDVRLRMVLHEADAEGDSTLVFWFAADWLSGAVQPPAGLQLEWVEAQEAPALEMMPDVRAFWPEIFANGPTHFGVEQHGAGASRLEIDGRPIRL